MYIFRRRHKKLEKRRCIRKNAAHRAKDKRRKVRMSGLPH